MEGSHDPHADAIATAWPERGSVPPGGAMPARPARADPWGSVVREAHPSPRARLRERGRRGVDGSQEMSQCLAVVRVAERIRPAGARAAVRDVLQNVLEPLSG